MMQKHVRDFIEAELGNFELYKEQVEELNHQIDTLENKEMAGRLTANIERSKFYFNAMNAVLETLPETHGKITYLYFMKGYPLDFVAEQVNLERRTISRKIAEVLPKFAIAMGL